jgi:hypothetical protein
MSIDRTRSQESASTPISHGGWKYNPADPQDVIDFEQFGADELEALERNRGYDFTDHPAKAAAEESVSSTTRHYVAWATTTTSMPGADPGITVTSYDLTGGDRQDTGIWHAASDAGRLEDTDALRRWGGERLDEAAADTELAVLGWRRTQPWQESGGQWAAEVEPV